MLAQQYHPKSSTMLHHIETIIVGPVIPRNNRAPYTTVLVKFRDENGIVHEVTAFSADNVEIRVEHD